MNFRFFGNSAASTTLRVAEARDSFYLEEVGRWVRRLDASRLRDVLVLPAFPESPEERKRQFYLDIILRMLIEQIFQITGKT